MNIHGTGGILLLVAGIIFALLFILIGVSTIYSLVAKPPGKDRKD